MSEKDETGPLYFIWVSDISYLFGQEKFYQAKEKSGNWQRILKVASVATAGWTSNICVSLTEGSSCWLAN